MANVKVLIKPPILYENLYERKNIGIALPDYNNRSRAEESKSKW